MSTVFDEFKKELTDLCKKHNVGIFPSMYDSLQVWFAKDANEIDDEISQLEDFTTDRDVK